MEWISVKDSLPDKYDRVLVTDGKHVCLHYKQSRFDFEGEEGGDLYCSCPLNYDRCGFVEGSITHWMKLPEVPHVD